MMKKTRLQKLAGITEALNDPVTRYAFNLKEAKDTLAKLTKLLKGKPSSFDLKKAADGMPRLQGAFNSMSRDRSTVVGVK